MRLLVTIPHYYRAEGKAHGSLSTNPAPRLLALSTCLTALQQLYGRPQCLIDFVNRTTVPANVPLAQALEVVICTTGDAHLLDQLPLARGYFQHRPTTAPARLLGFECQTVLAERLGQFDYYCYLEDDLILHDPWFFVKLAWFTRQVGTTCLLQPHRYEVARNALVHKAYVDGDLADRVTAPFQDITQAPTLTGEVMGARIEFRRARNPHSGCFFLTAAQLEQWLHQPHFGTRATDFIGPLESAATLGIMRTFKVYKTSLECASFLEIEHYGTGFLSQIRPQPH